MTQPLLLAVIALSWIVIAALGLCVLALARQVGVLHERIAPVGALAAAGGPAVGELAPRLTVNTLEGREVVIGARQAAGRPALLLFVSGQCPICKVIIPVAKDFARLERLDLVLVADAPADELQGLVERFSLHGLDVVNSAQLGLTYQVAKLPYAVLIAANGILVARGLVNSREHLESLVVAHETGVASIQSYLAAAKRGETPSTSAAAS
jgi:methylamine dehydrogenase accessory protein MauD